METVRGHLLQSRYYSNGVMNVGRGYVHGQGEAVLVDQNVDFYSFDFLSTVDAAFPAGRRRPARPAVRHEDRGIGIVAVDHPPPAEKIDQRPKRFHRAKQEYTVVNGIPVRSPIVRHCMPP